MLTIQNNTGIQENETAQALSLQLSPNPFNGATEVTLSVAEEGMVHLEIVDVNGHHVGANDYSPLQPGMHRFRVVLAHAGVYVLSAHQNGKTSSVKLVCGNGGKSDAIEYLDVTETAGREILPPKSHTRGLVARPFDLGDQMEYINVTNITDNSAICDGDVVDGGGDSVMARGICISLLPNPTLADRHTVDGSGMGTFTSQITGLSSNQPLDHYWLLVLSDE